MSKVQELKLLNKWQSQVLLALVFTGITYGFASLAIDSGNLIEYALTIFFLVWAIKCIVHAVRNR